MSDIPDAIVKVVNLKAPLERVWHAITESAQFGVWFGARLDGPFAVGQRVSGVIMPTQVDDAVAAQQKPFEGTPFDIVVETIEPMTRFAFRWPAYVPDADDDVQDPLTLVEFVLTEVEGGVQLTITESGFSKLPQHRRAETFTGNEGGWDIQTRLIEAYLGGD